MTPTLQHARNPVVQEEVRAMLKVGIIRTGHSPWASPVVMIPKSDGSLRMCIHYRKLNALTKPDPFQFSPSRRYPGWKGGGSIPDETRSNKRILSGPDGGVVENMTVFVTEFGKYEFLMSCLLVWRGPLQLSTDS